jgi:hypothetical protein
MNGQPKNTTPAKDAWFVVDGHSTLIMDGLASKKVAEEVITAAKEAPDAGFWPHTYRAIYNGDLSETTPENGT